MKKIGLFVFGIIMVASVRSVWAIDDENTICTMEYAPVCAEIQIRCVKAPCEPIKQTFGNKCSMNANKLAKFLYEGECKDDQTNIDLSSCESYFDGCNTCSVVDGKPSACTKMYCKTTEAPKCLKYKEVDLDECESYFDGCNFCSVVDGKLNACTMMYCENPEAPKCLKYKEPMANMANPASKFCVENSGTLEIVEGTGGQYGICKFLDGSKCEEWAFFRGECKPEYKKVHDVLDKYFDQNKKEFPTVEEKKTFLEGFVTRIKLISKGVKIGLWKTYRSIIKSIDLYFR